MSVALGKIAALDIRSGDKMLGKQSDMVGSDRYAIKNHPAIQEPKVLASAPTRQFVGDLQHGGLAELLIRVAQDRELRQCSIVAGVDRAVSKGATMHASKECIFRVDADVGQIQRDRRKVPGMCDALRSFETSPIHEVGKGMFLPAVTGILKSGVWPTNAAPYLFAGAGQSDRCRGVAIADEAIGDFSFDVNER